MAAKQPRHEMQCDRSEHNAQYMYASATHNKAAASTWLATVSAMRTRACERVCHGVGLVCRARASRFCVWSHQTHQALRFASVGVVANTPAARAIHGVSCTLEFEFEYDRRLIVEAIGRSLDNQPRSPFRHTNACVR